MASPSSSYFLDTYTDTLGAGNIREDLSDLIDMVSPTDTPFYNLLADGPMAKSRKHEWMTDDLATITPTATAANGYGVAEGADRSTAHQGTPTREFNYTMIFREQFEVTDTMEAVDTAGGSVTAQQEMKARLNLKNKIENALINATLGAGTGDAGSHTARTMMGLSEWITSEAPSTYSASVTGTGGTSTYETFTEDDINGLMQVLWDGGVTADCALMNGWAKRQFTDVVTSSGRNSLEIGALSQTVVNAVFTYITDFGPIQVYLERYCRQQGTQSSQNNSPTAYWEAYLMKKDHLRKSWLRPVRVEQQARNGDKTPYLLDCELTLVCGNPKAVASWQDLGKNN